MEEMRILSPTGILGYGFPEESFRRAMAMEPHFIGVDAGSTDPGPYYLGAGVSFTGRGAVKRDLELLLEGAVSRDVPLIIGSAGGSGAREHTDWTAAIVEEVARERGYRFPMAVIYADIPRDRIHGALDAGRIMALDGSPALGHGDIDDASRIVAQMGVEPIMAALGAGARVVVAGRAYDPAVFAALPIMEGFDPGLSMHLGKILECSCIAAVPGSASDCLMGYIRRDHFEVRPASPARKCTVDSVAAHTLYEKSDPVHLHGPGCMLDLEAMEVTRVSEEAAAVRGSRLHRTAPYRIKLEGAKPIGYRALTIAATRDPVMIGQIDAILEAAVNNVRGNARVPGDCYLNVKVYGKNGVMGGLEPLKGAVSHELCLIIEAIAATQEQASMACSLVRSELLHFGYQGRKATGGNLALPYSPSELKGGEVYVFCVYHLMEVDDPCECFPVRMVRAGGAS